CRLIQSKRGIFTKSDLQAALRPPDIHFPRPRLVCIENTHNRGGGSIWPMEKIVKIAAFARQDGISMHLDGARIWNASVAAGIPESEYARQFDSISVCFSKGLGAPVGSALAGTRTFIERARRFRKQFGGGMRQAGILAAGALFALEHHRDRLAEDHANARVLAEHVHGAPGVEVDCEDVETNIVLLRVPDGSAPVWANRLARNGVHVLSAAPNTLRAVTHLDVTRDQVHEAAGTIRGVAQELLSESGS
ncbi:threonine aldolase family protein, partial [Thermodesulfobacteriota bacterium]